MSEINPAENNIEDKIHSGVKFEANSHAIEVMLAIIEEKDLSPVTVQ